MSVDKNDPHRRLAAAQAALRDNDTDALRSEAANAAIALGDWRAAVGHLHALVRQHPGNTTLRRHLGTAISNLARNMLERGNAAAARAGFEQALAIWPDSVPALFNAATAALAAGDMDAAIARLQRLVTITPDDAEARLLLAETQLDAGRGDEITSSLGEFDFPLALQARAARAFARAGQATATLAFADAGEIEARALHASGQRDAARTLWRRVAARSAPVDAEHLRARLAERFALAPVPTSNTTIDADRARFAAALDTLAQEFPATRLRADHVPLDALEWSNFYLAYHGRDDRALQSRYGDWLAAAAAAIVPEFALPPARVDRKRPRVGVVSAFLRYCTVGSYFGAWIRALRDAGCEVVTVALGPRHDTFTTQLEAAANRSLRPDGDLRQIAAALRSSQCDLLIYPEIGMDLRTQVLAAMRLAPVQAMAWGHPVTSGLPTIDAYFSCTAMEPPGDDAHYRERLLLLSGIGTRYLHPGVPLSQPRSKLGLPDNRQLVLVPQSPFKLHPDNDAVFAALLAAAPEADLALFRGDAPGATRRLQARFATAGIDLTRLHWLPLTSRTRYLEINRACDLMLDTLHWSGGNTSIDALVCGLPVVTAAGAFMRGRQTAGILDMLGLGELNGTADTLAARTAALLRNAPRRQALGERLRASVPAMLADPTPLQALGDTVHALLAQH